MLSFEINSSQLLEHFPVKYWSGFWATQVLSTVNSSSHQHYAWVPELLSIWAPELLSIWAPELLSSWALELLSSWASEHLSSWASELLSFAQSATSGGAIKGIAFWELYAKGQVASGASGYGTGLYGITVEDPVWPTIQAAAEVCTALIGCPWLSHRMSVMLSQLRDLVLCLNVWVSR